MKTPQTLGFPCLGAVVEIVTVQSVNYLLQWFFSEPKGFVSLNTAHALLLPPELGC